MAKISILIVTWNSENHIQNCLKALSSEHEIIVVDNNSDDNTVTIVSEEFPEVHMIRNPANAGLSRALNQGFGIAHGKYILLLNPDVVVMENTIQSLCKFMETKADIGACGPRFFWPDGKIQPSCREFPRFTNIFWEFIGIARIFKRLSKWKMGYFDHNSTREVEQPMGSCLLIKKTVFDKIGGMNEDYPIFMNDVDLCHKIKERGYKIYFLPEANIIHYLGTATKQVKRKMILEEHWNLYRYLRDHFENKVLVALFAFLLLTSAFYRIFFSFVFNKVRKK